MNPWIVVGLTVWFMGWPIVAFSIVLSVRRSKAQRRRELVREHEAALKKNSPAAIRKREAL